MKTHKKTVTTCPSCREKIFVDDHPRIGQFVNCGFCEEELEIIKLNPIILDWPFSLEDDLFSIEYEDDYRSSKLDY